MRTIYHKVEIDLGDMLCEASDGEIIQECEDRDITVIVKTGPLSGPPQGLFESLCNQFDLPRAATTKQQLLTHISSLL